MGKYDFEVLVEEINENKKRAIQRDKQILITKKENKKKLLNRLSIALTIIILILCAVVILQFKHKVITVTPYGSYECRGKIIKLCSGSKRTRDYIIENKHE